ncbi:unnamed protein product [Calypogeia fissa]
MYGLSGSNPSGCTCTGGHCLKSLGD